MAVLSGAAVGTGAQDVSALRKPLQVQIINPDASLSVGNAFALRQNASTETVYLAVKVTNVGSIAQCFIRANGLDLRDEAGAAIQSEDFTYVQGSVGELRASLVTDTCLAPGESGFLYGIYLASNGDTVFSRAQALTFSWASNQNALPLPPGPKVVPTSYEVLEDQRIRVAFTNSGEDEALLATHFSRYTLLDAAGDPLHWSFLMENTRPIDGLVPVGTSGSVESLGGSDRYEGTSKSVRVNIDFDVPDTNGLSGPPTRRPMNLEEQVAAWNMLQSLRHARAQTIPQP